MKTVYIVYREDNGEYEAVATEDGKIIGLWACNDATWRHEYFNGFMQLLGFTVKQKAPPHITEKMKEASIARWGPPPDYEGF